ncbi:MAG: hypothetical protein AMXMBFR84_09720 [Candidatus Hydrogenedentota bacterium]
MSAPIQNPGLSLNARFVSLAAVLIVATMLFSANVGGYALWPADEPRFGQVAREILQSGDWLVLHVNGQPYMEKPPLFFWLIALASLPFGDVSEFTARVPSIAAALITLYFTFQLAARMAGTRAALMATVVLMTAARFWWQARTAQIDMVLTACLMVALYAFWRHHEDGKRGWLALFYGMIGAGLLAKGPPALVFPLLLIFAFHWKQRDKRKNLHWVFGLLASIAIVAAWFIPSRIMGAGEVTEAVSSGIGENLYRQIIGRFVLGVSKAQPPWYYLVELPADFFPWTLFVPWTVYWTYKHRKDGAMIRFLLAWILPAIVFFSISSGKRAIYLLPIHPAIAILIALSVEELVDLAWAAWIRRTVGVVWTLCLLLLAILPYAIMFHIRPEYGSLWGPGILVFCLCAAGFAIDAALRCWRAEGRKVPFGVAGHFAGLALMAALFVFPVIDQWKSAKGFCAPVRELALAEEDFKLYSLGFSREEYVFYAHRFHEPVLVEDFPDFDVEGLTHEEVETQAALVAAGFRSAVDRVKVAQLAAISEEELKSLRKAVEMVMPLARSKTAVADQFVTAITQWAGEFFAGFQGEEPAFMFVQDNDWRWMLAIDPSLKSLPILGEQSVGRRQVLLIANEAGRRLAEIPGDTNVSRLKDRM